MSDEDLRARRAVVLLELGKRGIKPAEVSRGAGIGPKTAKRLMDPEWEGNYYPSTLVAIEDWMRRTGYLPTIERGGSGSDIPTQRPELESKPSEHTVVRMEGVEARGVTIKRIIVDAPEGQLEEALAAVARQFYEREVGGDPTGD